MIKNKQAFISFGLALLPVIKLGLQLFGVTIPHIDDLIIAIAGGTGAATLAASKPINKKA
jgi:hypothetical protein